ncbi:PXA domain-containing protein [Aspergillus coremiiformis]|uniref:PXA domain-containing protein n=1 Tax=Aspergillus coremiiformis TaxID=138285 RepID=A0A5N6YSA6_9EURO|nr:PXA domain-containing protein [Aspergillus coremiiformis]
MGTIAMDHPIDVPSKPNKIISNQAGTEQQNFNKHEIHITQSIQLVDFFIGFLSTSSNETLLGVLVCLVCATYILLGRLGLLLIGVVSGIVLHASWEGMSTRPIGNKLDYRSPSKRKEVALDIAHRLLDWPNRNSTGIGLNRDTSLQKLFQDGSETELDYSSFRPETAAALRSLTDAIINNYVNCWYEPILPSEITFPLSCRRILTSFITSVSTHLSRKRTADGFLEFLTNSSSMVIVFLNELSTAFEAPGSFMTPEHTIRRYLELVPESSLANVLAGEQQRKKLSLIADDILSSFLDPKAYALPPLRDFLREILAGVILESTIASLSRPEFINGWIIHLFNDGESGIMSAIDAGVEGARNQRVTAKDSGNVNVAPSTPAKGGSENPSGIVQKDHVRLDKATEEAMVEAKRLSAMIAAQDTHHQNAEQPGYDSSPLSFSSQPSYGGERAKDHTTTRQPGLAPVNTRLVDKVDKPTSENTFEPNRKGRPSSPSALHSTSPLFLNQMSENDLHAILTLHHASITVEDGSDSGDKGLLRSKPTSNYLLQIEPAPARCTGWMVFRKYTDFESLHETLGTISRLSRVQQLTENYPALPSWKGQTKQALARNLERYLEDALQNELLAESERMKQFLEKDGRFDPKSVSTPVKAGFSFPSQVSLENVGKGVLGVLANAPKGVSDGSRAVFGGMTGVFGAVSVKKTPPKIHAQNPNSHGQSTEPYPRKAEDTRDLKQYRVSLELSTGTEDAQLPSKYQRHSSPVFELASNGVSSREAEACLDMPLGSLTGNTNNASQPHAGKVEQVAPSSLDCRDFDLPERSPSSDGSRERDAHVRKEQKAIAGAQDASEVRGSPITKEETRIAVELIFAVINELYTLSSAWNIRRTLLNAAKSYILRPGNPNLETIRDLLQESMIESNTSDEALGVYITKLRENVLPTEAELNSWPSAPDDVEKERLRETARKALVQKGLPQALTSVMGAAASREALEKVFDSLQIPIIARGLVFSLLIQALRSIIF